MPLITFPYVARILSADGLGKVNFSTSVIQYFILFSQMGIPRYGIRECAKYRDNKDKLTKTVQEILIINAVMVVVSYLVLFVMMINIGKFRNYSDLLIIMSLNIITTSLGIEWFYQAIEEYKYITVRSLIIRLVSLIMIFTLVRGKEDLLIYSLIITLAVSIGYLVNLMHSRKYINLLRKYKGYDIKKHINPILTMFALSVSVSIYVNLDKVMLGFISGDKAVGLYVAANNLIKLILALITSLGTVLLPRMSVYLANSDFKQANKLINKSIDFIIMIALPAILGISMLAKPIIMIFAGNDFAESVLTIRIISPVLLIIGISNLIGVQIFVAHGKEKITLVSTIIGAVVNFLSNLILIPLYEQNGAAIATIFAELIVTSVQIFYARSYLKGNINYKNIFDYLLGGIFIVLIIMTVNLLNMDIIYTTILSVIFSVLVYFAYLYIRKNSLIYETVNNYLSNIKGLTNKKNNNESR